MPRTQAAKNETASGKTVGVQDDVYHWDETNPGAGCPILSDSQTPQQCSYDLQPRSREICAALRPYDLAAYGLSVMRRCSDGGHTASRQLISMRATRPGKVANVCSSHNERKHSLVQGRPFGWVSATLLYLLSLLGALPHPVETLRLCFRRL